MWGPTNQAARVVERSKQIKMNDGLPKGFLVNARKNMPKSTSGGWKRLLARKQIYTNIWGTCLAASRGSTEKKAT